MLDADHVDFQHQQTTWSIAETQPDFDANFAGQNDSTERHQQEKKQKKYSIGSFPSIPTCSDFFFDEDDDVTIPVHDIHASEPIILNHDQASFREIANESIGSFGDGTFAFSAVEFGRLNRGGVTPNISSTATSTMVKRKDLPDGDRSSKPLCDSMFSSCTCPRHPSFFDETQHKSASDRGCRSTIPAADFEPYITARKEKTTAENTLQREPAEQLNIQLRRRSLPGSVGLCFNMTPCYKRSPLSASDHEATGPDFPPVSRAKTGDEPFRVLPSSGEEGPSRKARTRGERRTKKSAEGEHGESERGPLTLFRESFAQPGDQKRRRSLPGNIGMYFVGPVGRPSPLSADDDQATPESPWGPSRDRTMAQNEFFKILPALCDQTPSRRKKKIRGTRTRRSLTEIKRAPSDMTTKEEQRKLEAAPKPGSTRNASRYRRRTRRSLPGKIEEIIGKMEELQQSFTSDSTTTHMTPVLCTLASQRNSLDSPRRRAKKNSILAAILSPQRTKRESFALIGTPPEKKSKRLPSLVGPEINMKSLVSQERKMKYRAVSDSPQKKSMKVSGSVTPRQRNKVLNIPTYRSRKKTSVTSTTEESTMDGLQNVTGGWYINNHSWQDHVPSPRKVDSIGAGFLSPSEICSPSANSIDSMLDTSLELCTPGPQGLAGGRSTESKMKGARLAGSLNPGQVDIPSIVSNESMFDTITHPEPKKTSTAHRVEDNRTRGRPRAPRRTTTDNSNSNRKSRSATAFPPETKSRLEQIKDDLRRERQKGVARSSRARASFAYQCNKNTNSVKSSRGSRSLSPRKTVRGYSVTELSMRGVDRTSTTARNTTSWRQQLLEEHLYDDNNNLEVGGANYSRQDFSAPVSTLHRKKKKKKKQPNDDRPESCHVRTTTSRTNSGSSMRKREDRRSSSVPKTFSGTTATTTSTTTTMTPRRPRKTRSSSTHIRAVPPLIP